MTPDALTVKDVLILSVSMKETTFREPMRLNTKQLNTKQMKMLQRQLWESVRLIVPGTTISLTLMPTYIEVRDKGVIKKKISLKAKSFEDVALELQKYLRYLGKRLAPGVLEEILERIGLPKLKRVIPEAEPTPKVEPKKEAKPEPEDKPEPVTESEVKPKQETVETKTKEKSKETIPTKEKPKKEKSFLKRKSKEKEDTAATFIPSGMSGDEKGLISADDFDDISDALKAVESLSDSFLAPSTAETPKVETKPPPKISINLEGKEEITAAQGTYARAPEIEEASAPEIAPAPEEEDVVELVAVTVDEDGNEVTEDTTQRTPAHQIKPVITCKALLLGEAGVGKKAITKKGGFAPIILDGESNEVSKYIFTKMVDGLNHRVDMRLWSFDLAVQEKLPRKDYYNDADLLFIAYSASDRWSFESIDFWLRETSISCEVTPPIIIIANKIDIRSETVDDSGEEPVSYNEGFQFAEELAKKLGKDGKLHPVAFIETSAETGEKIEDIFTTAAELYENNLE